jgi:alpha-tubulin suppressor-like RCC1 family protein
MLLFSGLLLGMVLACEPPGSPPVSGEDADSEVAGKLSAPLLAMAAYDASLQAPACGERASGCDSGSLLDGRSLLGPEPHAPNLLGEPCLDGAWGTYHVDESVDRIRLYTTDGTGLSAGKQVTVEVTLWAYSIGNRVDLYFAEDATHPSWTPITTLTPPGGGPRTLTATYTLPPSSTGMQAVRASLRFTGGITSCTGDGYNDRDDLAFTVSADTTDAAIAGGARHSMALRGDGTVWSWGDNTVGQLGVGTSSTASGPRQAMGLTDVNAIAAGGYHSLALRTDGTVWAWGYNRFGQLGDGKLRPWSGTPRQVSGLTSVIAIAAGQDHSMALCSDGTVWTWGANSNGQLGDGSTLDRALPVRVPGLPNMQALAAGDSHSLAVDSDGTAWAWGANGQGQLGDGTALARRTPVKVLGLSSVRDVAAGQSFSLALRTDGDVWSWGRNSSGELGDGTTTSRATAAPVPGLTSVRSIAAGLAHALVLRSDDTVWAWGFNGYGQLGDDANLQRNSPQQVPALTGLKAIGAGPFHSLVVREDGSAWAAGYNFYRQLGDGTDVNRSSPVQVLELSL